MAWYLLHGNGRTGIGNPLLHSSVLVWPDPLHDRDVCPCNEPLIENVLIELFHPVDECQVSFRVVQYLSSARLKALNAYAMTRSSRLALGSKLLLAQCATRQCLGRTSFFSLGFSGIGALVSFSFNN